MGGERKRRGRIKGRGGKPLKRGEEGKQDIQEEEEEED